VTAFPIVLMGSSYWAGLLDWLRQSVVAEGKASRHDLHLLHVTDDIAEAVELIRRAEVNREGVRQEEIESVLDKEAAERRAAGDPAQEG